MAAVQNEHRCRQLILLTCHAAQIEVYHTRRIRIDTAVKALAAIYCFRYNDVLGFLVGIFIQKCFFPEESPWLKKGLNAPAYISLSLFLLYAVGFIIMLGW